MAAPSSTTTLQRVVEAIFTFPPVFNAAAKAARSKIMQRGRDMGTWADFDDVDDAFWRSAVLEATTSGVRTPDYYRAPFHAYPQGNLSLDAALEVTNAARSVHATVFNEVGSAEELDPNGDERLRSSFSEKVKGALEKLEIALPENPRILDIGAATGLSSVALLEAFPGASVLGVDLSPYFVAVGRYLNRELIESGLLTLEHGAAEELAFVDDESLDMASMCLVCHELPQDATRAIFTEAYRKLKKGSGVLCVMEMDPTTPAFQRVLSNAVPYVVFKSTEPYLLEYVALDMEAELRAAGFADVVSTNNSPRHKTVVAVKK